MIDRSAAGAAASKESSLISAHAEWSRLRTSSRVRGSSTPPSGGGPVTIPHRITRARGSTGACSIRSAIAAISGRSSRNTQRCDRPSGGNALART